MDRLSNLKRVLPSLPTESLEALVNEIEQIIQPRFEDGERCEVCHHVLWRSRPEVVGGNEYICCDSGPLAISRRGIIYRPGKCRCRHKCHAQKEGDA